MPWREVDLSATKPKFGVMWEDGLLICYYALTTNQPDLCTGVVTPSPACGRALFMVVDRLKSSGYEVIDLCASQTIV